MAEIALPKLTHCTQASLHLLTFTFTHFACGSLSLWLTFTHLSSWSLRYERQPMLQGGKRNDEEKAKEKEQSTTQRANMSQKRRGKRKREAEKRHE